MFILKVTYNFSTAIYISPQLFTLKYIGMDTEFNYEKFVAFGGLCRRRQQVQVIKECTDFALFLF